MQAKKLPLANNFYQQLHSLARHEVGDQPTDGSLGTSTLFSI